MTTRTGCWFRARTSSVMHIAFRVASWGRFVESLQSWWLGENRVAARRVEGSGNLAVQPHEVRVVALPMALIDQLLVLGQDEVGQRQGQAGGLRGRGGGAEVLDHVRDVAGRGEIDS